VCAGNLGGSAVKGLKHYLTPVSFEYRNFYLEVKDNNGIITGHIKTSVHFSFYIFGIKIFLWRKVL